MSETGPEGFHVMRLIYFIKMTYKILNSVIDKTIYVHFIAFYLFFTYCFSINKVLLLCFTICYALDCSNST